MGASSRRFESCPHRNVKMENNHKLTLRDFLAIDRTRLANQRTLLAYFRTALILLVTGISLAKLFPENKVFPFFGTIMAIISAVVCLLGVVIYLKEKKNLKKFTRPQCE